MKPKAPLELIIKEAVDVLNRGGIIGYPTETVYGLGGDGTKPQVVRRIQKLKGRHFDKPLLILTAGIDEAVSLVSNVLPVAKDLMDSFWPGPLTLLFQGRGSLPVGVLGPDHRIGIRVSSDPVCMALLKRFNKPLISTSANPEGEKPATGASEVEGYFECLIDFIVDGGIRKSSKPSTVLDVSVEPPVLIRSGVISKQSIQTVVGRIDER